MSATYRRQMQAALGDAAELVVLLERHGELTLVELMTAIGLATMAHDALLRAAAARSSCDKA